MKRQAVVFFRYFADARNERFRRKRRRLSRASPGTRFVMHVPYTLVREETKETKERVRDFRGERFTR